MEDLCGLSRTQQRNTQGPFSTSIHRPGPGYVGRKEILFFPRWIQWVQLDLDRA
jgi:hypothetical protein